MRRIVPVLLLSFSCLAQTAPSPSGIDVKWFNGLEYRFIGPANMGGRVTDVEGIPGNASVLYVGTGGSGFWKTTNGGVTWTAIFEREGTYSVGDFALDPRNPEVIWLGTGEANMRNSVSFGDGVYKSTDGGKSWKHLGLKETEHIARVLVSPLDSNVAWVCAVGHQAAPNDERGVFVTTDGGTSWKKTLFIDDKHGCADLDVDPVNPNVLYASVWRFERKPWNHTSGSELSGIFKSVDGGLTWKKLTNGLPKLLGRTGVKVAPSNPETVYVAAESKEGTLYRSTNGGEKWEEMTRNRAVVARGFYYADLRVDPVDPNRVYAVAGSLLLSIDGGRNFRTIAGKTHVDYHSLWIDPKDPTRLWEGSDGGVAVSYDRGQTWNVINNIPLGQFYQIHADNRTPFYSVSGGLQDNGSWGGPSRVRQNSGITNADWTLLSFGDGFYTYTHPDDPEILISESQGGSILRQDLRTGEIQSVSPQPRSGFVQDLKYRFNWNTPIAGSPHGKSTIFIAGSHLFQSRDFGKSWEPISPDLTNADPERLKPAGGPVWMDNSTAENYATIISFNESPVKAGVLWAGTDDGNVQLSPDAGRTWSNVAKNLPGVPAGSPVSHVEPSRTSPEAAYVALDRHLFDDYRPHIFKTTDSGKTWVSVAGNLPAKAYVQIVREDPKNPQLLYAGTELGLYVSFNGGGEWQPLLLKNLSKVAVHDILVHPRENDLILGTHGRSVAILDDISALQQMTPEIAAKPVHLFPARPALRHAVPMRAYGIGDGVYAAPNPPYGALQTYYLKTKLNEKAPLKLVILDGPGKIIRTLDKLPRDAGIQRVAWDLRHEGPKSRRPAAPEDQPAFGFGPRGPQVVPGIYTVRLTAGDQTVETKVEVRMDPNLKTPTADLVTQRDMTLKLNGMQSSLNLGMKRLDSLKKQLQDMERLGKEQEIPQSKEWSKSIVDWNKEIDKQISAVTIPADSGRLDSPPRIAENLSALAGQIGSGNSAPTAAQTAYLAELEKTYTMRISELNAFLTKTAQWSDALRKMGAPGLVGAQSVESTQ